MKLYHNKTQEINVIKKVMIQLLNLNKCLIKIIFLLHLFCILEFQSTLCSQKFNGFSPKVSFDSKDDVY